ncbi:hypothetical protein DFH06DRAFT_1171549 [Mycena polygramma]|nr:hypothetical protein DFH06DRAFT_1171549 [Mycena polygramma]
MPQATMIQTPTRSIGMEVSAEFAKWLAFQDSDERKAAVAAQAQLPPPLEPDYDMPPPIPAHLRNCDCVYGYTLTDAFVKTYFDAHPPQDLESPRAALLSRVIFDVADRLGIEVDFERDFAFFSYTRHGKPVRKVPSEKRMKMFTDALGFAEPQWIDSTVKF